MAQLLGSIAGDSVTVEKVSADVVFNRPVEPAPVTPPPDAANLSPPTLLTTEKFLGPLFGPPGSGFAVAASSAVIAAATVAVSLPVWLAYRRAGKRRRAFNRAILRLEDAGRTQLWHPDATAIVYAGPGGRRSRGGGGGSDGDGGVEERRQETAERLTMLEKMVQDGVNASRRLERWVEEGLEASRSCPWDARGENSRKSEKVNRVLSDGLANAERAKEELALILEVERLLYALDSSGEDSGEDSDAVLPPLPGRRRGQEGDDVPSEAAPRLSTRISAMIGTGQTGGRPGRHPQRHQPSRGATTVTRCVFRRELEACREALAEREQKAVDELKWGLRKWNIDVVDRALGELRALGLQELAADFEEKREDVRSKRWGLQTTLRVSYLSFVRSVACTPFKIRPVESRPAAKLRWL